MGTFNLPVGPLHRYSDAAKHPVAGATGKWFAEKTIIGNKITEKIGRYPDPTQHWAVVVGNYVHQLWMVRLRFKIKTFRVLGTA